MKIHPISWRLSAPLRLSCVLRANLKGAEKKRTLQKHPFGQPFLRTTPSPLLWRTLILRCSGTIPTRLHFHLRASHHVSENDLFFNCAAGGWGFWSAISCRNPCPGSCREILSPLGPRLKSIKTEVERDSITLVKIAVLLPLCLAASPDASAFLLVSDASAHHCKTWRLTWRVAGRESGSPELLGSPGLPRKFPELPRKFFGDFSGSSLTVELRGSPEVSQTSPEVPQTFPEVPQTSPEVSPFLWEA